MSLRSMGVGFSLSRRRLPFELKIVETVNGIDPTQHPVPDVPLLLMVVVVVVVAPAIWVVRHVAHPDPPAVHGHDVVRHRRS